MQAIDTNPFWTRARAMFARAAASVRRSLHAPPTCGALGPDGVRFTREVASIPALSRSLYRELIAWVRLLEHVVRKLLFAEAWRLAPHGESASARSPIAQNVQERARCAGRAVVARSDHQHPESWRARFSITLPRRRRPATRTRILSRAIGALREPATAFHLARRLEALRRVLANPAPYVARLTRVLARKPNLAQHCAWTPCHTNNYDPADPRLSLDAMALAARALDSS